MLKGGVSLSRLELLALLYSLDRMCKKKDYEGVEEVVTKLIDEAESQRKSNTGKYEE